MKKIVLTLIMVFSALLSVDAQEQILIKLANGDSLTYYVWDVDTICFTNDKDTLRSTPPEATVDLGLSVLWAPYNLGASDSTEVGFTVGWGDITGKNQSGKLKYFPTTVPPTRIVATDKYDIAHHLWGDYWRLPTEYEIKELIDSCIWTKETNGWKVVSKKNAAEIFLPCKDTDDAYWSGNLSADTDKSKVLALSDEVEIDSIMRYTRCAVRPVYGEFKSGVNFSIAQPTDITTYSCKFNVNLEGDLADITKIGICFTEDEITVPSEQLGQCKIIYDKDSTNNEKVKFEKDQQKAGIDYTLEGFDFYTKYYYFVYAVANGITYYSQISDFTTLPNYTVPSDEEAVDLGLSVKWSPYSIGATKIGEEGGLYGWGDATGELTSTNALDYGPTSVVKNIANTEYDMAHVQWKSQWRLPTEAELKELYDNCTSEWISNYQNTGVRGYLFTGKNGNTLFIPYAGYREGNSYTWEGTTACFWTCEANEYGFPTAVYFRGYNYLNEVATYKYRGLSIRPVFGEGKTPGTTPDTEPDPEETDKAGKAVDLGLSVLWADRNVGATSSTEQGDFYRWGELTPGSSTSYFRSDYSYFIEGTSNSFTYLASDISGNENYDASQVEWAGKWRIPTRSEVKELIDGCTFKYTTDGVYGYVVTSKTNGNSIFLPSSGYKYDSESYGSSEGVASYWTSTSYDLIVGNHSTDNDYCYVLLIDSSDPTTLPDYRYFGRLIRPVRNK